ncbi:unnamed protein product [Heterobilharzia americana]|nr:unnamed protein product [Heterobilharzia americana]
MSALINHHLTFEGGDRILHYGCHGGAIYEPLNDLNPLLKSLTDNQGNILVPGIYDEVQQIDPEEIKRFEELDFNLTTYQGCITSPDLQTYDKVDSLRRRWCLPCLSIHGIENSFDKPGAVTLIPRKTGFKSFPDNRHILHHLVSFLANIMG